MFEEIAYIGRLISQTEVLYWFVGTLLIVGLLFLYVMQLRARKVLRQELAELGKFQNENIEYEFVLKALRLATWHINPQTMKLTFDYDFRDIDSVHTAADASFSDILKALNQEDAQRVYASINALCEGRSEEYHETYRVINPETNNFYWEESSAIITRRDVDGKPLSIVGTSQRVDERKNMEKALILARTKAEESDRMKSAFIANMSHE
nr:PAS domain-containing protein [Prevotella sp.]